MWLQGRLFSYYDTHLHRLGPNHLLLPVNSPFRTHVFNTHRDGQMCYRDNQNGHPNYYPSSFVDQLNSQRARAPPISTQGDVDRSASFPRLYISTIKNYFLFFLLGKFTNLYSATAPALMTGLREIVSMSSLNIFRRCQKKQFDIYIYVYLHLSERSIVAAITNILN